MGISTYAIGYIACERGVKQEDNPFPKVGEWYRNWERGWLDCNFEQTNKKLKKLIPLKLVRSNEPATP